MKTRQKTARSSTSTSISTVSGCTNFATFPLSPGPFENNYSGSIVVPAYQTITFAVSASLTVLGVLSIT